MESIGNEKKETKKVKKIGFNTLGIMLILFGIFLSAQMIFKFDILRHILMLWPIIFIFLGIETIYYSRKSDVELKFSIGSTICIFTLLFIAFVFGMLNFAINQIVYNEDLNEIISEHLVPNIYHVNDEDVTIVNYSDCKEIYLVIDENNNYDEDFNLVNIDYEYNPNFVGKNISRICDFLTINEYIYKKGNKIYICDVPDIIGKIVITVKTNNKDNIITKGDFNKK